jgi:hypothetical protein
VKSRDILDDFSRARDETLELELERYVRELKAANEEIEELTHELDEVKKEIQRVQRPEGRRIDVDNKPSVYHPPPGKPSSRPRKRLRLPVCTPTQNLHDPVVPVIAPASASSRQAATPTQHLGRPTISDVIWVDSESEGEHAPASAPAPFSGQLVSFVTYFFTDPPGARTSGKA